MRAAGGLSVCVHTSVCRRDKRRDHPRRRPGSHGWHQTIKFDGSPAAGARRGLWVLLIISSVRCVDIGSPSVPTQPPLQPLVMHDSQKTVSRRHHVANGETIRSQPIDKGTSMVQPPSECFWKDAGDGLVTVSVTFDNRWVRLSAWGFLLVSCSNHSPKMHSCSTRRMGQTDRRTDIRTNDRSTVLWS